MYTFEYSTTTHDLHVAIYKKICWVPSTSVNVLGLGHWGAHIVAQASTKSYVQIGAHAREPRTGTGT